MSRPVRASGILLHVTSLPSAFGIGDLGPAAHAFARLLAGAGQTVWQFLPLTPTSTFIGNSPYSSPSAFAGNTLLVSPERLAEEGFVSWADVDAGAERFRDATYGLGGPGGSGGPVHFEAVEVHRRVLLRAAWERNRHQLAMDTAYLRFCRGNAHWLDDYARFVVLKERFGGAAWPTWDEPFARRHRDALARLDSQEAAALDHVRFCQYLFFRQWYDLRAACTDLGVRLVGDVPIYVTHDSADVWANPGYFRLDADFAPTHVAGVPPDYFSATGQRWGNPVYDWDALRRDGFAWWVRRVAHNLRMADIVRLDHFRGFAGYWEIPAAEETAVNGRWVDAPGMELFGTLARRFTALPLIAEDLGVITADVRELKAAFGLPGMKVLQFGFGGDPADNPDVPFRHDVRGVVYTGTHDNAPTRAWFEAAPSHERARVEEYVGHSIAVHEAPGVLLRLAMGSVAELAVAPVQDVLGLGAEARMNTPSVAAGNWAWRMTPEQMEAGLYAELGRLTRLFGR